MGVEDTAFWLRMLNFGLALFVAVTCFTHLIFFTSDRGRQARILALGFLASSLAIGSYELRQAPFGYRLPLATLGILIAAYGMHKLSEGPTVFSRRSKKCNRTKKSTK